MKCIQRDDDFLVGHGLNESMVRNGWLTAGIEAGRDGSWLRTSSGPASQAPCGDLGVRRELDEGCRAGKRGEVPRGVGGVGTAHSRNQSSCLTRMGTEYVNPAVTVNGAPSAMRQGYTGWSCITLLKRCNQRITHVPRMCMSFRGFELEGGLKIERAARHRAAAEALACPDDRKDRPP